MFGKKIKKRRFSKINLGRKTTSNKTCSNSSKLSPNFFVTTQTEKNILPLSCFRPTNPKLLARFRFYMLESCMHGTHTHYNSENIAKLL